MSEHASFAIALGIAVLVASLLGLIFLLPECAYEPTRESCMAAKRQGTMVYGISALGFLALSVVLHIKGLRGTSFLAVLGLMIVPFLAATLVSR